MKRFKDDDLLPGAFYGDSGKYVVVHADDFGPFADPVAYGPFYSPQVAHAWSSDAWSNGKGIWDGKTWILAINAPHTAIQFENRNED